MLYILVSFAFLAFAEAEPSLCATNTINFCPPPEKLLYNYVPGSVKELLALCPSTIDHVDCLNTYDIVCEDRNAFFAGLDEPVYYERLISVLKEACDENSPKFNTLAMKLPCIKTQVDNSGRICERTYLKYLNAHERYLRHKPRLHPDARRVLRECLEIMTTTACVVKSIEEKCGYKASEIASDFVLRSQVMADRCSKYAFFALQKSVDELDLRNDEKRFLKKYLQVHIEE